MLIMNIEALSSTGEKEVLATAIYLIKQTLNDNSGTFETSLKNIYELFLHSDDLLQTFEATSQFPASAVAIAAFIANELAAYRLTTIPIEISELNNLLAFLNNYRLLTNQNFTALQTTRRVCSIPKMESTTICRRAFCSWRTG